MQLVELLICSAVLTAIRRGFLIYVQKVPSSILTTEAGYPDVPFMTFHSPCVPNWVAITALHLLQIYCAYLLTILSPHAI